MSEFGAVVKAYHGAAMLVWNDPAVWLQERNSEDTRLLQWPRPIEGTGYQKLLAVLFNANVDFVLRWLEHGGHPALPTLPPDVSDRAFQIVLRVVHRGFLKGKEAIETGHTTGKRVFGRKEYKNEVRRGLVDLLQRSGLRAEFGDDAFLALGISRAAAFRHMGKKPPRK